MRKLVGLLCGAILCLTMGATVSADEPLAPMTLDIQHTKPADIVWSTVRTAGERATVSGLVRHRGPPARNGIYGHVVAAVERSAAGTDSRTETRIDVPLVAMARPHTTERDARFSFNLPAGPSDTVVVHLRYVEARMPPRE
jgi:hypothetical protein